MDIASILIAAFVVIAIFGSQPQTAKQSDAKKAPQYQAPTLQVGKDNTIGPENTQINLKELIPEGNIWYSPVNTGKITYADNDDAQVITSYIVGHYKKVPIEEAELISKSILKYGVEHNVDPRLVAALIARESSFNRFAVSSSDARGLGQIKDFNYPALEISDPFDVEQGVKGCARYLALMLKKWDGNQYQLPLALASYAEGYGAISRAQSKWKPGTDRYIRDILTTYKYLRTP